jgi:hypothetical protein
MMRVVRLALIAVLVVGCASAVPTAGPSPTPLIIYVTPSPTPSPSPTPMPTPTPSGPTMTADDDKIDTLIRDGAASFLALAGRMTDPRAGETIADVFRATRDFADNQQVLAQIYRPSNCTQAALDLYVEGLVIAERESQKFLDWVEGSGPEPDTDQFTASGLKVGAAVRTLNESGC